MASADKQPVELDALIVGAGFGGCYQLMKLRKLGFTAKLVEAGTDYGGVWYWNRYPGAMVDIPHPFYEFSDPALWSTWRWKHRFPASPELRAYFQHVADVWDLRRDTLFGSFVDAAVWDDQACRWRVTTRNGHVFRAKFLSLNTGFSAKRHVPDWPGIDSFRGVFLHPSYWPHTEPDLRGKKVAVIGTGSTGVQIASALAGVPGLELTVFQRTINMAMPMAQRLYDDNDGRQEFPRDRYPALHAGRVASFGGIDFNWHPRNTFDDTPDERRAFYQALWDQGDFRFWLNTYQDLLFDAAANREAYAFWRDKTRARIRDARARDLLAPVDQPYAFGCKRISLETSYFDIFDQPNVSLVDMKTTPIERLTPAGIRTADGRERAFDYIVSATGYDAVTGGLKQMGITGLGGQMLAEYWRAETYTYLGMAVHGFPNMMFTYGPQAPTALCNGPFCAEMQGDYVAGVMEHMREKGWRKVRVDGHGPEEKYREIVTGIANASLLPGTHTWYMGTNIPGKTEEPLIYLGGVPSYYKMLEEVKDKGYEGFRFE